MSREPIKDMRMGKHRITANKQNIKSTVFFNPDIGYYIMMKGNQHSLKRVSEKKYELRNL